MRLFGGTLMNMLDHLHILNMCAGGFPRDLAIGKEPKDLDIIIYGDTALASEESLRKELGVKSQSQLKEEQSFEEIQIEDYVSDRIAYVIKVGHVDIICYNAFSEGEVFSMFDYNINQYKMHEGKPKFMGENEFTLTEVRGDKTRLARMQELAKCWV